MIDPLTIVSIAETGIVSGCIGAILGGAVVSWLKDRRYDKRADALHELLLIANAYLADYERREA